ncbi:MAG: TRAM domain-containing protein [Acidobacteria bacterium]|nr:TRAM domain-containing protein [Acidobacteriota bacterium]
MDLTLIRSVFIIITTVASYHIRPFRLPPFYSGLFGVLFGLSIVLFEMRLRRVSLKRLIGAVIGSILGILGAYLMTLVLAQTNIESRSLAFLQIALLLFMTYVGLVVGANKGDLLNLTALGGLFGSERPKRSFKIVDTSVIIDGRIADICETGFVDGILLIPQFVLRELQLVADSGDALKRNRGRRGLDILQRIQKIHNLQVEIIDDDFPHLRDVDLKLIELAKRYDGKIVTNDFNLNKLAQLQGLEVLNINELANALKPIVLPGETMRVFILKEGKEHNQGVAYLDDGTMVVVDNARRLIGKTIDVIVTSVLQTTAGKMIFGRFEEARPARPEAADRTPQPAGRNQNAAPEPSPQPERNASNSQAVAGREPRANQRAGNRGEHYEVVSDE